MSEHDLKNIKLNNDEVTPLMDYMNRTEDHEIDYIKWHEELVNDHQKFMKEKTHKPEQQMYNEKPVIESNFIFNKPRNFSASVANLTTWDLQKNAQVLN